MSTQETLQVIRDTIFDTVQVLDTTNFINLSAGKFDLNLLLTAGIALLAVLVSTLTLYFNHRHNRLLVEPFLSLRMQLNEAKNIGISIVNSGLGPSIIDFFGYISKDGRIIRSENINISELTQEHYPFLDQCKIEFENISKGTFIAAGEEIRLLYNTSNVNNKLNLEIFEEFLTKSNFRIYYKTVYGENRCTLPVKFVTKIFPKQREL